MYISMPNIDSYVTSLSTDSIEAASFLLTSVGRFLETAFSVSLLLHVVSTGMRNVTPVLLHTNFNFTPFSQTTLWLPSHDGITVTYVGDKIKRANFKISYTWFGLARSVKLLAVGWTIRVWSPEGPDISVFCTTFILAVRHSHCPSLSSPNVKRLEGKAVTCLVPGIRMTGAVSPLSPTSLHGVVLRHTINCLHRYLSHGGINATDHVKYRPVTLRKLKLNFYRNWKRFYSQLLQHVVW